MPFCVFRHLLNVLLGEKKSHLILKYIDKTVGPHPRMYLCHCQLHLFIHFLCNRESSEGVRNK